MPPFQVDAVGELQWSSASPCGGWERELQLGSAAPPGRWKWGLLKSRSSVSIPGGCNGSAAVEQRPPPVWLLREGVAAGQCLPSGSLEMGAAEDWCCHFRWLQ